MNVVFVSSLKTEYLSFKMFNKYKEDLRSRDIHVRKIVIDSNSDKKNLIFHLYKISKRQIKHNKKSVLYQMINVFLFSLINFFYVNKKTNVHKIEDLNSIKYVDSINSERFVKIIRKNKTDVICLLGTRIVSSKILNSLSNVLFINIHSGDPSKYRGQPAFFWEIFDKQKNVQLTIHEATKNLDSGRILKSKSLPILYSKNLFKCLNENVNHSEKYIFKLFFEVLIDLKEKNIKFIEYQPHDKIMVVPTIIQLFKAQKYLLKNSFK